MINTYKLTKTWRYLLIIPSAVLFLMFWLLYIFGGGSLDMPIGAWILIIGISAFTGWVIFGTLISRINTSPNGIKSVMLGITVEASWAKVEKIDRAPDGIVNLIFKEPIYKSQLANAFLSLFAYDKMIQLSPFIDDLATSNLVREIAEYVASSHIREFVAQQKPSTKTYQKAGMIGLYYFGWSMGWILSAIVFQKRVEEYLATLGISNAALILDFVGLTLLAGLFVNTINLLRKYNTEAVKCNANEIARKARAYYISPVVLILIGLIVGVGIWALSGRPTDFEIFLMFLIGLVSPWVSSKIERLLFQGNSP